MSNIFYWVKKDLFGCFRREREKDNETGLKEGGGIKMSTTVLPYTASSLKILTNLFVSNISVDSNSMLLLLSLLLLMLPCEFILNKKRLFLLVRGDASK